MISEADRLVIQQSRLFRGASLESIERILNQCPIIELGAEEILLAPDKENDCVYLILAGRIGIHLETLDPAELVDLGPGESFSELSLIKGRRISAFVVAMADSRLLAVPEDALWSLVNNSHGVARNLLHIVAGRLRAGSIGVVASLAQLLEFEDAAMADPLTGIHNRLWLEKAFPRTLRRHTVTRRPLSIVLADIDHFNAFNETRGPLAGDHALRLVGQTLASHLRPSDLLARSSADRFAAMLPDARLEKALGAAERLRAAVASADAGGDASSPPITVSIGLAEMQPDESLESLVARAEAALRLAKLNGCNRVESSPSDAPAAA